MRRSTDMDDDGGTRATFGLLSKSSSRRVATSLEAPNPSFDMAQRYLELLAGGDDPHKFQPYYDPDRKDPNNGWMSSTHLRAPAPTSGLQVLGLQQQGAAIAVTMAETDGRGRKAVNMLRPRAVWIEADGPLSRELRCAQASSSKPLRANITTSISCAGLDWELWQGVQQLLIDEYGSDPRAGLRTQVLRLPGTLHQKDPAKPHLVRIVEDLSSWRVYTAAEIAAAFPPTAYAEALGRLRQAALVQPGPEWEPEKTSRHSSRSTLDSRRAGHLPPKGIGPTIKPIKVDWSLYDWWLRATAAIHHASGGSDAGFELSCQGERRRGSPGL